MVCMWNHHSRVITQNQEMVAMTSTFRTNQKKKNVNFNTQFTDLQAQNNSRQVDIPLNQSIDRINWANLLFI